ncbi:hypothetical protein KC336_g19581, partial [Hortaea werneckii]
AQEQDSAAVAEGLGVDSDEGARLKKALKRTGVGETEEKFEFFQRDIVISQTHGDFPLESLSDGQSWTKLFKDEATRIQTCVSGFATELAQMGLLGKQTISWFIEQIPIEENEGLREAYVDVVSASSAHPETVDAATLASFRNFYYTATFPNGSNSHQVANAKRQGGLSQNSKTELNDDDIVNPLAGIGGVCTALADLALANLDDFVRRDAMLRFAIHDTIKALCDQLDVAGLEAVYQYFKTELLLRRPVVESDAKNKDGGEESKQVQSDEKSRDESEVKTNKLCLSLNLQCRLVSSLPTGKSTLRLLRRKLALLLITRSDRGRPLESEDWTAVILNRLRKWRVFQITEATDYALLASLVDVLDIAIGPGFSDFAFLNKPSEKAEQQQPPTGRLHFGRNAHTPRTSSPEEHAFNSQIDTLTQMLQKKSSHIKDGSMSDLQRTEAKAVLGRVIMRLEHAVRTRPKLKRGVFDDGPDAESVGLMDGFVKRDGGKNEGREVMGMEEGAAGLKYSEVDGRQVEDTSAGDVDMVPDDQADDAVDTVSGAEVDSEGKGHRQRGESEEQHPAESRRLWGFGIGDVRM